MFNNDIKIYIRVILLQIFILKIKFNYFLFGIQILNYFHFNFEAQTLFNRLIKIARSVYIKNNERIIHIVVRSINFLNKGWSDV